jgi:uncharacterized integral membrane protein
MIRALIFAPLLFLLVLFALSNQSPVELKLWPSDIAIDLPLSIAMLLAMTAALIVGALMMWVSTIGARLRARKAEANARMLQAQVTELKARLAAPGSTSVALPPPS